MNKKRSSGLIIGGILVVLAIYLVSTYNSLVKKDEKVNLQANEIQNAYQRRIDLIPNLVNTVKGQADFEQNTIVKITEARSKATSVTVATSDLTAENYQKQIAAQNELATATNHS